MFFPTGEASNQVIRVGDIPVTVVGVLKEKVFRFRDNQGNIFAWRNQIVAVPATLVAERMQGDVYHRLDRVVFKIPDINVIEKFSEGLSAVLRSNHRQQEDFRIDDIAKRVTQAAQPGSTSTT